MKKEHKPGTEQEREKQPSPEFQKFRDLSAPVGLSPEEGSGRAGGEAGENSKRKVA